MPIDHDCRLLKGPVVRLTTVHASREHPRPKTLHRRRRIGSELRLSGKRITLDAVTLAPYGAISIVL